MMREVVRLFTGYDAREHIGWATFVLSVLERSSLPVQITSLGSGATERDGTNAFTYSRWDVARHCNWSGPAIFMDGVDMLMLADIAELWAQACSLDLRVAAAVVKHKYKTKHRRKYIGTELEARNSSYPKKNWSSVVLWDCGHWRNRDLTPEFIAAKDGAFLHRFGWLKDDQIGALHHSWNVLIGEGSSVGAKVAHFTLGIPGFKHYSDCPYADEWRSTMHRATRGLQTHALVKR